MLKRGVVLAGVMALCAANAYAAAAPIEEEGGFPLALAFALMAVFCSLGVVLMAAANKKKD